MKSFSKWFRKQFGITRPKISLEDAYRQYEEAKEVLRQVRSYETQYEAAKKAWYAK